MQFIEKAVNSTRDIYFCKHYPKEQILFFDIETTGFSAVSTKLYFIGCMTYATDGWVVSTWFNDDGNSEEQMLSAFMEYISHYQVLIHYNGDGFDIPYLQQKCKTYHIPSIFSSLTSIDLYKLIRPYRHLLDLPNLKLKTIEEFLGITRTDIYTGGDLIAVYDNYLRTQNQTLFSQLYTHNYEDICNMLICSDIAYYKEVFDGNATNIQMQISKDQFKISCQTYLPRTLTLTKQQTHLYADHEKMVLTIPVINTTLNYYFPNYKDYYYLPIEDTAIHKSVAVYMDKNYRQKATRENCYQKINDTFIPTYHYAAEKCFGTSYSGHNHYMLLSETGSDTFDCAGYLKNALAWFLLVKE